MTDTSTPYRPLFAEPAPPPAIHALLRLLWDTRRAEGWLLNGAFPDGCSAPGEHLTATGTDADGRWAVLDGDRLRRGDCEWLRHITEVGTIAGMWWRTGWQPWPKRPARGPVTEEIRLALKADPDDLAPMFQLYAGLAADGKPDHSPDLRTFQDGADPQMPTDAAIDIPMNLAVTDVLEWLLWLPFDGRRSVEP